MNGAFVHFTSSMKMMFEASPPRQRDQYAGAIFAGIDVYSQAKAEGVPAVVTAEATHAQIDGAIRIMFEKEPGIKVSCRRGCNHCCKIMTQITPGEAQLLLPNLDPADLPKLRRQAEKDDAGGWATLAPEDKLCVFNKGGDCSVYARRPMACRKYFVKSDPGLCKAAEDGSHVDVDVVASPMAEIIATAAGTVYECAPMAQVLLKQLENVDG